MRIRSDKNEQMDKAFRKIYAMYRSGHSIREIVEACNYLPEIYVIGDIVLLLTFSLQ